MTCAGPKLQGKELLSLGLMPFLLLLFFNNNKCEDSPPRQSKLLDSELPAQDMQQGRTAITFGSWDSSVNPTLVLVRFAVF